VLRFVAPKGLGSVIKKKKVSAKLSAHGKMEENEKTFQIFWTPSLAFSFQNMSNQTYECEILKWRRICNIEFLSTCALRLLLETKLFSKHNFFTFNISKMAFSSAKCQRRYFHSLLNYPN